MADAIERTSGRPSRKSTPAPAPHVPAWLQRLQPGVQWRKHPNGGGWVSETAYVEQRAYVGPQAVVFDRARVLGRSKVLGESKVYGDAEVWGASTISAGARVHGVTQVTENAHIKRVEVESGHICGNMVIATHRDLAVLSVLVAQYKTMQQVSA